MWNFIIGAVGGYLIHAISMKVSFKQRTIENKIKVFDAIIIQWVKMRNFVFHDLRQKPDAHLEFDKIYGESQTFIGEAILVSEDVTLAEDINSLNERLYRSDWQGRQEQEINSDMDDIKIQAMAIIKRMRDDISKSTIFEFSDFLHILSGLNIPKYSKKSMKVQKG